MSQNVTRSRALRISVLSIIGGISAFLLASALLIASGMSDDIGKADVVVVLGNAEIGRASCRERV